MGQIKPLIDKASNAYEAVFSALSRYHNGEIISTRLTIDQVRERCPACKETDDQLLELIVMSATGRHMAVHFDHRN